VMRELMFEARVGLGVLVRMAGGDR